MCMASTPTFYIQLSNGKHARLQMACMSSSLQHAHGDAEQGTSSSRASTTLPAKECSVNNYLSADSVRLVLFTVSQCSTEVSYPAFGTKALLEAMPQHSDTVPC